jgi:hypothetical protein
MTSTSEDARSRVFLSTAAWDGVCLAGWRLDGGILCFERLKSLVTIPATGFIVYAHMYCTLLNNQNISFSLHTIKIPYSQIVSEYSSW